jgi:hypothetical protein
MEEARLLVRRGGWRAENEARLGRGRKGKEREGKKGKSERRRTEETLVAAATPLACYRCYPPIYVRWRGSGGRDWW